MISCQQSFAKWCLQTKSAVMINFASDKMVSDNFIYGIV